MIFSGSSAVIVYMLDTLEPLVVQARQLSSGTIATLTGECRYVRIDVIRQQFVEFCESMAHPCDKWQHAWIRYQGSK